MAERLPSGVVTFVMIDVPGAVSTWDSSPAVMTEAVAAMARHVADAVADAGGTLVKAGGENESALAVFPRASDGLRAACRIAEFEQLEVRVGVHTGEAFERDGDFFGPALNRVARLRSLARPGEVVCTATTGELARDRLPPGTHLADQGLVALRGMTREERIFSVVSDASGPVPDAVREGDEQEGDGAGRERHVEVPLAPPLALDELDRAHGRAEELDRLERAWKDAATGIGGLALVAGEPGVGKTRLAAEVARRALADGGVVLYGRCDEDLGVAYQPMIEVLRAYLSASGTAHLGALARRSGGELVRLVPELADRIPALPTPVVGDPETERYLLFQAVATVFGEIARRRPMLVVFDDMHWANRPTVLLLRHLARAVSSERVLIVCTYRDTEVDAAHPLGEAIADLRRERGVLPMRLSGLDEAAVAALVESAAGHALDAEALRLASILHSSTHGNPYFVNEILNLLAESGAVYQVDGRWTSDVSSADELVVPDTVRDVVARRIARLGDRTGRLLTLGAIAGETFDLAVLELAADEDSEVLDDLEAAVDAGLLVERPGGYAFRHALVRAALLASLSAARCMRLHRRVGEALEQMPDRERRLPQLALHFAEAAPDGVAPRAVEYGLLAGRGALDRLAYEEAVAQLERALTLGDTEDAWTDPDIRTDLHLALSEARWGLGDRPAARDAAHQAALAARTNHSAEGLAAAADLYLTGAAVAVGVPDDVGLALADEALAALDPDDEVWRPRVLAARAWHLVEGESLGLDGLHAATEAVRLARTVGDDKAASMALIARSAALWASPDVDARAEAIDELMSHAERVRHLTALAEGILHRAALRFELGDRPAVEAGIGALHELAQTYRSGYARSWSIAYRAMLATLEGRFEEAASLGEEVLIHGGEDVNVINVYFSQLMALQRDRGELAEFEAVLAVGVEENPGVVAYRAARALFHAELGRVEEASQVIEELAADGATRIPRDQTWTGSVAALINATAVLAARGDGGAAYAPPAETLLRELRPFSGRVLVSAAGALCLGAVDRYLAMAALTSGDGASARAWCDSALALETQLGSPPHQARTRLWRARARITGGDLDGAREDAAWAREVAGRIGMLEVEREAGALLEQC